MRKLISLSVLLSVVFVSTAQTPIAGKVAGSVYLQENTYAYYLGATTDTLVASDTLSLVFRVTGQTSRDLNFGLLTTKVTGTVTNNWVFYHSMDGANWSSTGDTIKNSNASTNIQYKNLDDFNYPYLKLQSITAETTQKAWYKVFVISRNE